MDGLRGTAPNFVHAMDSGLMEYDKDAPVPWYQWRIDDLKRDIAELEAKLGHQRRCTLKAREAEDKAIAKLEALEAENKRLTGALSLIERSTGGFANGVATAALGEDE